MTLQLVLVSGAKFLLIFIILLRHLTQIIVLTNDNSILNLLC